MRQILKPGHPVDFVTPDEMQSMISRPREVTRVRAAQTVALNAAGGGQDEILKVPSGYEFEARRVVFSLAGNIPTDPVTGAVALNAAGHWVAYLRSGSLIEYAQPTYGAALQVPGAQTWGDEQGPYLRNAEVFEVACLGLGASAILNVYLEGLLTRPGGRHDA